MDGYAVDCLRHNHSTGMVMPLTVFGMTIHKSQGQTLTKAVVYLGKGEKVAGCTFVAGL
jgi:uncharacterized protein (DUF697 family)